MKFKKKQKQDKKEKRTKKENILENSKKKGKKSLNYHDSVKIGQ